MQPTSSDPFSHTTSSTGTRHVGHCSKERSIGTGLKGGENKRYSLTSNLALLDSAMAISFLQHSEHICMWPHGFSLTALFSLPKHTMHSLSSDSDCFFARDSSAIRLALCTAASADDMSRGVGAADEEAGAETATACPESAWPWIVGRMI